MNIFDRIRVKKIKNLTDSPKAEWNIPFDLLELKNSDRNVSLRDALESPEMKAAKTPLSFPIGKDADGHFYIADLFKSGHILAGGQTASGKSSFTEGSLILSLIYRNSPDDLKLIIIDPRQVQFSQYDGLPHLLCPIITDSDNAKSILEWLLNEMAERYSTLSENRGVMNINDYNNSGKGHMPFIVLIIDEVADLMMANGKYFEMAFVRLLQKSRAVGIHLYISTSRPDPAVLPGLLKANFSTKIAFLTASRLDSRRMLDVNGAEDLSGCGDLLLSTLDEHGLIRLQAPYVSDNEVRKVVEYITTNNNSGGKAMDEDGIKYCPYCRHDLIGYRVGDYNDDNDDMYKEAVKLVIESRKASASLIQRKLRVGYARAARMIDRMEEKGIIGPSDGAKPRKVIVKKL